jgi:hypothetical protein
MDRFVAKSLILFLLLASLSGTTFLIPKQNVGSMPQTTPGVMGPRLGTARLEGLPRSSELQQYTAGGHVLGFRKDGVVIASGSHALKVEFVNARPVSPVEEGKPSEPAKGRGPAPALGKVAYRDLWDGVTVVYEGRIRGGQEHLLHPAGKSQGLPPR